MRRNPITAAAESAAFDLKHAILEFRCSDLALVALEQAAVSMELASAVLGLIYSLGPWSRESSRA